jgi:hypothetical protein
LIVSVKTFLIPLELWDTSIGRLNSGKNLLLPASLVMMSSLLKVGEFRVLTKLSDKPQKAYLQDALDSFRSNSFD